MVTFSISALLNYFKNEQKSISRGENHYKSGHILTFNYSQGTMSGKVRASMKNRDYNVEVHLSDDLNITSTLCECPKGAYKCSHSATLYIHGLHNISRTDIECKWKKKVEVNEGPKTAEQLFPPKHNYRALQGDIQEEDRAWFFNQLQSHAPSTGLYWLMTAEPDPPKDKTILPIVEDVLKAQCAHQDQDDRLRHFLKAMTLGDGRIYEIAEATKGQRNNPSWHTVKKGKK